MARTLGQVDARLTTEITRRSDADKLIAARLLDIETRLRKLEPPVPPVDPPPPPPPVDPPPPVGSIVDLGGKTLTSGMAITKSSTIRNGTFKQGGTALDIRADDVTVTGLAFDGGNNTIRVYGDRVKIVGNTFVNMRESSIRIVGPGADDCLIEGNTIVQSVNTGSPYSPIACNDNVGRSARLTVRDNDIDNGPSGVAHFGVEVWAIAGLVIEGNRFKGAGCLVSIPRSDGCIVRDNDFDMSQAFWGIELSDVDGADVFGNTVHGNSSAGQMWRAFVQLHPGSGTCLNNKVSKNKVTNFSGLVNAAGYGHSIVDNCLVNVGQVVWGSWAGAVDVARNGPC